MNTTLHRCAVPGCRVEVRTRFLMCPQHWRRVPTATARAVTEAYHAWLAGDVTTAELRAAQAVAVEAVAAQLAEGGAA